MLTQNFGHMLSQSIRSSWKKRIIGVATPIGINCPPVKRTPRWAKIFHKLNWLSAWNRRRASWSVANTT